MSKKLLVIGSDSPHVIRFMNLVNHYFSEIVYVGEQNLQSDIPIRQYAISVSSSNPLRIKTNYQKLKRVILDEKADVIHVHQVNRLAYATARICKNTGLKYIVTAWGTDVLVMPNRNALYRYLVKYVLRNSFCATADSGEMISAINKLASGIQTDLVFFGIQPIQSLHKENIIYSNRSLYALYNITRVVDLFNDFYQSHKDWKLVIAGRGDELESLKKKAQEFGLNGVVEFVGWQNAEQNNVWYGKAKIYISIPVSDGTSVSLLEAMSAGCIPVVSDLPVSHEWINDNENGIITNFKDNPFERALKLDVSIVAEKNARIIQEKATAEIASNAFVSLYRSLIIE
ncbi:MAG: glycosyltransferase [Crocinitomicaceae bacterium]|nr:glycosyltransferase [Crocinitomicaceae bacterium]